MKQKLEKLIQFITKHFPFDENNYPELKGADENRKKLFAINHIKLHMAKSLGVLANFSERSDHNKPTEIQDIKTEIHKIIISTLRLASLTDTSAQDIINEIEAKYKTKID